MSTNFYFPPKDRIGYIVVIILIIIITTSNTFYEKIFGFNESEKLALIEEALANHEQSIKANQSENSKTKESITLSTFNPNKANKSTLISQGFSEYAATNLEKYRIKGGQIKSPEDLYKIYGLDSSTINGMKDRLILPNSNKKSLSTNQKTKTENKREQESSLTKPSKLENTIHSSTSFDPNTATIEELITHGLSTYAANNLKKYISKGGVIYKPQDLLRIYGVDSATYYKLLPQVNIKEGQEKEQSYKSSIIKDTVFSPDYTSTNYNEEYPSKSDTKKAITQLNINIASKEELITIPGIGPVISKGIVGYREKLGGYLNLTQLMEVYGVSEDSYNSISKYLYVEGPVNKFYIPSTKFKEVLKHLEDPKASRI